MKKLFTTIILISVVLSASAGASEKRFSITYPKTPESVKIISSIDTDDLFDKICNFYGIYALTYSGKIIVAKNRTEAAKMYEEAAEKKIQIDLNYPISFYMVDSKTIYINLQDYNKTILTHEIAHAIISAYFVVSPTIQIQEILSQWAVYKLTK